MKRILLVFLLLAGSISLKAQQLLQLKPGLKLDNRLQHYFKPDTGLSPKDFLLHGGNDSQPGDKSLTSTVINGGIVYSNMPVVKLWGTDHMPIAVPDKPGVKYTMLVKKMTVIDPVVTVSKQAP
jgi:hypothetical protein